VTSRRPGPIAEEYWGCRRSCWDAGGHTEKEGCAKYVAPCTHPVESIGYDSEGEGRAVECQDCQTPLSVRKLAEEARAGLSIGGCFCTGACVLWCSPATPTAWSLDPAMVLRILELESHL
jgi:hypothetical protein